MLSLRTTATVMARYFYREFQYGYLLSADSESSLGLEYTLSEFPSVTLAILGEITFVIFHITKHQLLCTGSFIQANDMQKYWFSLIQGSVDFRHEKSPSILLRQKFK